MLRKARDPKVVCLRKPQPAPDFRGPAAPIPPLCFRAFFLTHPHNVVVTNLIILLNTNFRIKQPFIQFFLQLKFWIFHDPDIYGFPHGK